MFLSVSSALLLINCSAQKKNWEEYESGWRHLLGERDEWITVVREGCAGVPGDLPAKLAC